MTPKFLDKNNQEWKVELNGPIIKDIQEQFNFKITSLDADPLNQMANDPVMAVDVLYLLCEKQASERGMDSRAFGECLPPGIDGPLEALREALINFFPLGKKSAIRSALEASQRFQEKASQILAEDLLNEDRMERLVDMARKKLTEEMEKAIDSQVNTVTLDGEVKT